MKRIAIGCHNLSTETAIVKRSGISETVVSYLKSVLTQHVDQFEVVPVFYFPTFNFANTPNYLPTTFNPSVAVIDATLTELGVDRQSVIDRWPYLKSLFHEPFNLAEYEKDFINMLLSMDGYFETSLSDVRNVMDYIRRERTSFVFGSLVYDLVPLLYPAFTVNAWFCSWFRDCYLASLRTADFLLSISRHTAIDLYEQVFDGINPKPHIFYSQILVAKIDEPGPKPIKENYILCLATLEPRKNISFLVEGFVRCKSIFADPEVQHLNLVLIGAQGWKSQNFIDGGWQNRPDILSLGYLEKDEMNSWMIHAQALAVTTFYEGFGIPIAQAIDHGLNVISFNNSSIPEASLGSAIYVDPENVDDLACAIRQVAAYKKEPTVAGGSIRLQSLNAFRIKEQDLIFNLKDIFDQIASSRFRSKEECHDIHNL